MNLASMYRKVDSVKRGDSGETFCDPPYFHHWSVTIQFWLLLGLFQF